MPRPMRGRLAFSYTGLHSTVERYLDTQRGVLDERARLGLARSFQKAAVAQIEEKLVLGMRLCRREDVRVRALVVSGGVASNQYLRERCVAKAVLWEYGVNDLSVQVTGVFGYGESR